MNDTHHRITTLTALGHAISSHRAYLEAMNDNAFLPGIAWTARNILELSVWTKYCERSEQNAKGFHEDVARDAISMMKLPDEVIVESQRKSFKHVQNLLLANAVEDNIDKPAAFMRVANAAKEVNFPHFGKINMILSKWAHPTALSVFSFGQVPQLGQRFYGLGCNWANTSLADINTSLVELSSPTKSTHN